MSGKMTEGTDGKRRFNPQNCVEFYDEEGNSYGIKHADNKPRVSNSPYLHEIAKGTIPGKHPLHVYGTNPDVSTSLETVWCEGGIYVQPTEALAMTLSCGDTNDTSEGTGARTVTVYGLDADFNEINETKSLNGQTAVNLTNSYMRLLYFDVETAGSEGGNIGKIYIGTGELTDGVPATIYCCMCEMLNKSIMSLSTIPADHTGYINELVVSTNSNKGLDVELYVRSFGKVYQIRYRIYLYTNAISIPLNPPIKVTEKADIEVRAKAAQAGGGCGVAFGGWYQNGVS